MHTPFVVELEKSLLYISPAEMDQKPCYAKSNDNQESIEKNIEIMVYLYREVNMSHQR